MESVSIPQNVTQISSQAFQDCSNLKSITIPTSVTNIAYGAFMGCGGVENIYYAGTQEQWNAMVKADGNSCLQNATIHFNSTGPTNP